MYTFIYKNEKRKTQNNKLILTEAGNIVDIDESMLFRINAVVYF